MFAGWRYAPVVEAIGLARKGATAQSEPRGACVLATDAPSGLTEALLGAAWVNALALPTAHAAWARAQRRVQRGEVVLDLATPASVRIVVADAEGWLPSMLATHVAALAPGGRLILVGRGERTRAAMRLLEAGLIELEQRQAGRFVITSGLRLDA